MFLTLGNNLGNTRIEEVTEDGTMSGFQAVLTSLRRHNFVLSNQAFSSA